jgi:hypothetical protein
VAGLAVLCLLGAGVGELAAKATEADLAKVRVGMDRTSPIRTSA